MKFLGRVRRWVDLRINGHDIYCSGGCGKVMGRSVGREITVTGTCGPCVCLEYIAGVRGNSSCLCHPAHFQGGTGDDRIQSLQNTIRFCFLSAGLPDPRPHWPRPKWWESALRQ